MMILLLQALLLFPLALSTEVDHEKFCDYRPQLGHEQIQEMSQRQPSLFSGDATYSKEKEERFPFKALFILSPLTKPENKIKLERVFESINNRLGKMIKGPALREIRYPRSLSTEDKKVCKLSIDYGLKVPSEFVLPCKDQNGNIIPEENVSPNQTQKIQQLISQKFTVVSYVGIWNETDFPPKCDAGAWAGRCSSDSDTKRPTHGVILLCYNHSDLSEMRLENILIHELIHVLGVDFSGGNLVQTFPCSKGQNANRCENVTWKSVEGKWINKDGTTETRTRFFSLLPSVLQAGREYYKCDNLDGVEIDSKEKGGVWRINTPHWPVELFYDVMSHHGYKEKSKLSAFTLGVLKDSNWYDVDMNQAEPMPIGESLVPMCDVAKKSCHQIVSEAKNSQYESDLLINPYCVKGEGPLCSIDGQTLLICKSPFFCPSLYHHNYGYEHAECRLNTKITGADEIKAGARVGKDTTCLTFMQFKTWKGDKREASPMCVEYSCQPCERRIAFKVYPKNTYNLRVFL